MTSTTRRHELRIWWFAAGYFACYVPYTALTKLLSDGHLPGSDGRLSGLALLPLSTLASLVGMFTFLTLSGWWRFAGRARLLGWSIPVPSRWTLLSGLATAAIIATTTLAYTFEGVSIVFMMLLMRGGVLVIAPVIDGLTKRKVGAASWIALALSVGALLLSVRPNADRRMTALAGVDVGVYLLGYFLRLRFMSKLAKSDDHTAAKRYFVEEQMVATPALALALALYALLGDGTSADDMRWGFTDAMTSSVALPIACVGLLSQGTGIFGGLVLLDPRENVFCVAINRASSVLAGALATLGLWAVGAGAPPGRTESAGAALLLLALAVLAAPTLRSQLARER